MSAFDLDAFCNQTTDAPLPTRLIPVDAGDYLAIVASHDKWCDVRVLTEGKQAGRVVADILFEVQDEAVKAKLGMETVRVRKSYWLDINAAGKIDFGPNKNVALGQLREAVGQNKAGIPFSMLKGAGPLRITVIQEPDERDASIIYNRVTKTVSPTAVAQAA